MDKRLFTAIYVDGDGRTKKFMYEARNFLDAVEKFQRLVPNGELRSLHQV